MYLAHSKKLCSRCSRLPVPRNLCDVCIPEQSYAYHIIGVYDKALKNLGVVSSYMPPNEFKILRDFVLTAAILHDLGKLCPNCQDVLQQKILDVKMPIHTDAGTAHLLYKKCYDIAWLVCSHHIGFGDYSSNNGALRIWQKVKDRCPHIKCEDTMKDYTDGLLSQLLDIHNKLVELKPEYIEGRLKKPAGFYRLALSCLVDGDHYNTAKNYKNFVVDEVIALNPMARIEMLDRYVGKFPSDTERNKIRREVYAACRSYKMAGPFAYCSSEVGTGKTTAAMATALSTDPRKIIYVAPYTSIISQTVGTFRSALTMPGEDPRCVVGEHHHQVDNDREDEDCYKVSAYATIWESPIVCTTAVQFCETLASARTRKLRKYFNLSGSCIIIDESDGCIPVNLWPLFLMELKFIVENLGCRVIFVSGSMVKIWEHLIIKKIFDLEYPVPAIIPLELADQTLVQEENRVPIEYKKKFNLMGACKWFKSFNGSRLIICNTIKNTAEIAKKLREMDIVVEHLSTCLTPEDREKIIRRVDNRLKKFENFVLVATSCVEAGMNFSFRYGFRELASFRSAIQAGGRVRRQNEVDFIDSTLWIFELEQISGTFTANPDIINAVSAFKRLLREKKTSPKYCDEAIDYELMGMISPISTNSGQITPEKLLEYERTLKLGKVHNSFKVINENKVAAIPQCNYDLLLEQIRSGKYPSRTEVVRKSFQFYSNKAQKHPCMKKAPDLEFDGFYVWTGSYDSDFLGYMQNEI